MRVQRYIVLLKDDGKTQVWLGYNDLGRIGSCDYKNATRYESWLQAYVALCAVGRVRRWPDAKILATMEEVTT